MSFEKNKYLFEKFEIIETLKKDEFTSVYLANHIFLGKKIILKTLDSANLSEPTVLERFKREAKILAQLDHPNIIKVLDFGMFKNYFYISFEHFESRNLRSLLKSNSLNFEQKISLLIQIMKGLNHAHQNSIIHRDIKPENILIDSNYNLKIADFGLALAADENLITKKSSIVGTPTYMSPEQIRGEKLTNQSDLFSAGIVLYELFTEKNPFVGNDINYTINNILNFNEETLANELKQLPEKVKNAIQALLRKNPRIRTSSAEEVLDKLGIKIISPAKTIKFLKVLNSRKAALALSIIGLLVVIILIYSLSNSLILNGVNNKEDSIDSSYYSVQTNRDKITKPSEYDKTSAQNEIKTDLKSTSKENKITKFSPSTEYQLKTIPSNIAGKLAIECYPWAEVFVNDKKFDTTPLEEPLRFLPGEYEIKLIHPDFPAYIKKINLKPDEFQLLEINFYKLFGFLDARIYPWGEISIDGNLIGQTPFRKPIALKPGKYTLLISNPSYERYETQIDIKNGDTLIYQFNFNKK